MSRYLDVPATGSDVVDDDLEREGSQTLRSRTIGQAFDRFDADYAQTEPASLVVTVCAYEEEGNIAGVLEKMPPSINGEPYTVLVVVDGGNDRTGEIARSFPGVLVIEFPRNLGHGVALQVAYRYCINRGVRYLVTLDGDGQNDPGEIPQILAPLLDDALDFVLASRVLGRGPDVGPHAKDRRSHLLLHRQPHDEVELDRHVDGLSRAARVNAGRRRRPPPPDAVPNLRTAHHLPQEGWRVGEVPTVWHERNSGESKKGRNSIYGLRYARVVFSTWWRER